MVSFHNLWLLKRNKKLEYMMYVDIEIEKENLKIICQKGK